MTYTVIDNFLPVHVTDYLVNRYGDLNRITDLSSYDRWTDLVTQNKTLPECYINNIVGKEKFLFLDYVVNAPDSPYSQINPTLFNNSAIAIQKIPTTGWIPEHWDDCIASLTLFLNKEPIEGGDFVWRDAEGTEHVIQPKFNRAICAVFDKQLAETGSTKSFFHWTTPVKSEQHRISLQMFIYTDREKNSDTSRAKANKSG